MKKLLFFLVSTTNTVFGQAYNDLNTSTLHEGYPQVVKQFFDFYGQYKMSEVETATIQTGIDTLQAYFGTAHKKDSTGKKFYWSAIAIRDSLLTLKAGFLLNKDPDGFLFGKVDLVLGNKSTDKIIYSVKYFPNKNELQYRWLDEKDQSFTFAKVITDQKLKIGVALPELQFDLLDGKEVNSQDLIGKILVLNWWNTGCKPCISEMPGLNSLKKKYESQKDVLFLAVAHNNKNEIDRFLKKREFNYEQSIYNDKSLELFGKSYPVHLIVNKQGKISYYVSGGNKDMYLALDKEIQTTMKE